MNSLFRVSAINSYLTAQEFLDENPGRTIDQAKIQLSAKSYSGDRLDWEAVEKLRRLIETPLPKDRASAFRLCLAKLIHNTQPGWVTLLFSGRDVALRNLDPDTVQCLETAGVFTTIPNADVVAWLDEISILAISIRARSNLAKGRAAERLSLQYEKNCLAGAGINRTVEWVALNDNHAGYDILSWTYQNGAITPKLIEVKAYSGITASFYITRHEWETAQAMISPYVFQVWGLENGTLIEISKADVLPHIPTDNQNGAWQTAIIRLNLADTRYKL